MVAKRDNVVGQRVQPPAHGHNPLEIMTQQDYTQHPVTPPPELVREWMHEANNNEAILPQVVKFASQWGADQKLKTCYCYFEDHLREGLAIELRLARRPKPPTLKEQALKALKVLPTPEGQVTLDITDLNTIRRALEQLSDTQ